MRIGIFGHVGNDNLGDEAIIAAVIQNIKRRFPDAMLFGFTINPADTQARHDIRSFPIRRLASQNNRSRQRPVADRAARAAGLDTRLGDWIKAIKGQLRKIPVLYPVLRGMLLVPRLATILPNEARFLLECRRNLKGLDLMIVAGSHQLNDFVGGPWAFPYTVLKWATLTRMSGAKLVFMSMGAGPIGSWLGQFFIRRSLRLASYRSYRDETARRVVEDLGVFDKQPVVPDLAFSLRMPAKSVHGRRRRPGPGVVGINPLPFHDSVYWWVSEPGRYEAYVAKLARFADWLVDRGHAVWFVSTQLRVDPAVIADVKGMMKSVRSAEHAERIVEPPIRSLSDLIDVLAKLDIIAATRYHGILLSLALHKPVLAIAYHQKSWDLMNRVGLSRYVLDGGEFEVEDLTNKFVSLAAKAGEVGDSLRETVPELRRRLRVQYDQVLGLVDEARIVATRAGAKEGQGSMGGGRTAGTKSASVFDVPTPGR